MFIQGATFIPDSRVGELWNYVVYKILAEKFILSPELVTKKSCFLRMKIFSKGVSIKNQKQMSKKSKI